LTDTAAGHPTRSGGLPFEASFGPGTSGGRAEALDGRRHAGGRVRRAV